MCTIVGVRIKLILIINFGHNNRIHKKVQITVMITIKIVASLNIFGQGNYCTKNLCAMCTGTKANFSQCVFTILHESLGMRKLFSKWVPRLLTPNQKQQRVKDSERCLELFKRGEKNFLRRYVAKGGSTSIHLKQKDR